MKISENGMRLIKNFEGCALTAYKCPSGVWTIGYGHTGSGVHNGLKITKEQAEQYFKNDILVHENNVNKLVKVPLTQNQFDALVSLEYNIGYGNFASSTILKLVNAKKYTQAGFSFLKENQNGKTNEERYKGSWVFDSHKKVLLGLVKRRKAEMELFLK